MFKNMRVSVTCDTLTLTIYIHSFSRSFVDINFICGDIYVCGCNHTHTMKIIQHISVIILKWILHHVFGPIVSKWVKNFDHWIRHAACTLYTEKIYFLRASVSVSSFLIGITLTSLLLKQLKNMNTSSSSSSRTILFHAILNYAHSEELLFSQSDISCCINEWMNGKRITS